jgi:protoporphyrinogen oxidase
MQSTFIPTVILGGGITGLAAGIASGCPVFEREAFPGGICSSYYMRRGSRKRETAAETGGDAYRFEHGGGHWIFGGHPDALSILEHVAPCDRIARRSSVFFPADGRFVGFPIQHHLHQLDADVAATALAEMRAPRDVDASTMASWLEGQFGPTLSGLFFAPFHEAYTAGLWRSIAPQDGYKTPLDMRQVIRGAAGPPDAAGYNVTFLYPRDGLDALMTRLAAQCDLRAGHDVRRIDVDRREMLLRDGGVVRYERLLSTLPLNRMLEMAALATRAPPAPYTSVLVLNIGARRGPRYPDDHWLYIPHSKSGFHRVGFYSNVADHFVRAADRGRATAACLYVERSVVGGTRLDADDIERYCADAVEELQAWGFIGDVDTLDPSWVDVAYTWTHPRSEWVREATALLAARDIRMTGRYARWHFQGIADSLRDGLLAGQALRIGA